MYNLKNAMVFFIGVAAFMLVMVYLLDMPTRRRMDFILLSSTVGTALLLSLAAIYHSARSLLWFAQVAWYLMVVAALISVSIMVGYSLWNTPMPLMSQQWYAVIILLGMIGLPGGYLLGKAYWEIRDEPEKEEAPDSHKGEFDASKLGDPLGIRDDDDEYSSVSARDKRESGVINLHINPEKS
ncbi:TPA: hypothetical protein DCG61_00890 [Patescibacteria group bacterium]|nr:hypothetical protein [Patescibacteria group bacterium]